MEIKNFDISKKVLLVAEIGNNHEGSFELAKKLIYLAHQSGADAVKFQTIEPHLLIQKSNQERINTLKKFYLNPNQYKELASISNDLGIIFLSTPFSIDCLSWLKHLVPAIKISSGDITYISLLKKVAAIGKPIFLSTGMSTMEEIKTAIEVICELSPLENPKKNICIMHCISSYPTENHDANLNCLNTIKKFGCSIGYSDHTIGIEASKCAVALGARVIEKHFTISKNYSSFRDHQLSSDPEEMMQLSKSIKEIQNLLGTNQKKLFDCEKNTYYAARRSLVVSKNLPAGTVIQESDLESLRPLGHIPSNNLGNVVGKKLTVSLKAGEFLRKEFLN